MIRARGKYVHGHQCQRITCLPDVHVDSTALRKVGVVCKPLKTRSNEMKPMSSTRCRHLVLNVKKNADEAASNVTSVAILVT